MVKLTVLEVIRDTGSVRGFFEGDISNQLGSIEPPKAGGPLSESSTARRFPLALDAVKY